jgi:glyoxylase-like metal-dependent hydrolase (beta-lactamase superfamily II)
VTPPPVHRLELPTPFAVGSVNAWLLAGEPLALVDAGPCREATRAALDRALAEHGLRVEDIELVVLTHQHIDHVGLGAEVAARAGARVAASAPLATYLADQQRSMRVDDDYAGALMERHGVDASTRETLNEVTHAFHRYAGGSLDVDEVLEDGGTLVAGGRTFSVHVRPGHSPTDTVFFDASDGLFIGGDHLLERISSNPIAHVPVGAEDGAELAARRDRPRPLVSYIDGLAATAAMDVATVLPGHGAAFADHRDRAEKRIVMHGRRARRILRDVDDSSAWDLVGRLWRELPVAQAYLALSEVLGHLDVLERDGRVEEVERDEGRAVYRRLRARAARSPARR